MTLDVIEENSKWAKEVERSDPRKAFQNAVDPADGGGWVPLALSPRHRGKAAFGLPPKPVRGKIHVGPTKMGEIRAKNMRAS